MPKGQHGAADGFIVFLQFRRRELAAVAHVQQVGDLPMTIENAFALYFGWVGREYRTDIGPGEKIGEFYAVDMRRLRAGNGQRQAAFARLGSGARMGAAAAQMVLIFGDIRQMREIAEGARHLRGQRIGQGVQQAFQFATCGQVVMTMESRRQLADMFDGGKGFLAFLLAQGITEQAAEKADVLTQRRILIVGGAGRTGRKG